MFPRGIKANIIITMAVLLITAMLLIDFIMTIMVQRELIQSESAKGQLVLSMIESYTEPAQDSGLVCAPSQSSIVTPSGEASS